MGMRGPKPRTITEIIEALRLNSKFNEETECYLWQGRTAGEGYGSISFEGRSVYVHRLIYKYVFDEEPIVIRHTCDTPNCWNPEHLKNGSHADNVLDKVEKLRHHFGEEHYRHKLTAKQVQTIKNSDAPPAVLAEQFGVHRATIHAILKGDTWKHS